MTFHREVLKLNPEQEVDRLTEWMRQQVFRQLKRRGGVVGVSGGVDSAVVLALAVRAFGAERLVAVLMPERDSSDRSALFARKLCRKLGVKPIVEDLTATMLGFGCYRRRDEAVRQLVEEYDSTYRMKITLPTDLLDKETLNLFSVTVVSPEGESQTHRLRPAQYRQIVASTNFKQRARTTMLYYHAELHDYAVLGTAQKNEHDQGFFVKYGDGASDIRPLNHLYKTQVFQLAEYLGVPEEICSQPPTTDTYSAGSTQEEFFYRLPFEVMDLIWYAMENNISVAEVAREMDLTEEQVQRVFNDLARKAKSTEYLRMAPLVIDA